MARKDVGLVKGDWVVHTYYGVGQIKKIENKILDNQKTKYFKVISSTSTYFVPVDKVDGDRVRPVSSMYKIRKAVKALKGKPQELELDHTARKRQIGELIEDSSINTSAEVIRDLTKHRLDHHLNDYEQKVLEKLTDQMALEWSIAQKIKVEDALQKLEDALEVSMN
ncbi:MAG: hypothetical protein N2D54_02480 [Chloroflexota bacterium]